MLKEFLDGFQSLDFNTLTLSPIRVNWVKRWSKARTTSFIRHTMWVSSAKDGNTQLGVRTMVFRNV
jgi:hypothetical protein